MRASALIVASFFLALCGPHSATAQDWPARPVVVVVPLPAGTAVDSMARIAMQQLTQQVGQSFVVENRPGAGGTVGTNFVVRAPPDGQTLLLTFLCEGQEATVLQLPARPKTEAEAQAQQRAVFAG